MWNYWCNLGLREMFIKIGVDADLIYIPHLKQLLSSIKLEEYNFVIVNDIVHGISGDGPVINLDYSDLKYISDLGVPICGVLVESIYTYRKEGKLLGFAESRMTKLKEFLPLFSSFLCAHVSDVQLLRYDLDRPTFWLRPISFPEFEVVAYGKDGDLAFNGSLYPERITYIEKEVEMGLNFNNLVFPNEDTQFWVPIIKNICDYDLNKFSMEHYNNSIVEPNNNLRKCAELSLVKSLSRYQGIIHLPAYFRGCHPRVIQSLQASALPLTPILHGIESYWLKDGVDCIYYDPDIQGDLVNKYRSLSRGQISEILMSGRSRNSHLRTDIGLAFDILNFINDYQLFSAN